MGCKVIKNSKLTLKKSLKIIGHKTEEYRRMLGKFGVSGDLALQQVIF